MKNSAFVIWMIGYPMYHILADYLHFLMEKPIEDPTNWGLVIIFAFWVFVGWLVYEPKESKKVENKENED